MKKLTITRTVESSTSRVCGYGTRYRNFFNKGVRDSEEGGYIVLITVLVLGAIVSIIVGFLLLTGQNASIASNSVVANANAKAAATGCAQLALGAIATNNNLATPATATQTLNINTGQTCTYTVNGSSPNFSIAVTGTVTQGPKNYKHRLSLTTNQVSPKVIVSSWQDSP
ncbi:MAG: hypothetical protein ABIQ89_00350 [Candidatus Saccharimonadales bacterium]